MPAVLPTTPRRAAVRSAGVLALGLLVLGSPLAPAAQVPPTLAHAEPPRPVVATVTARHVLGSAVSATAAPRGSLVYVRNHNVWVARADGRGGRAVTRNGTRVHPWVSPTQADSGVIVAARDGRIVRMTPAGRVLNSLNPRPLRNSAGQSMDGTPTDVAISPNGRVIAYTFALYGCPPALGCDTRFATAYTRPDRLTNPKRWGTTFFDAPSWVTSSRVVTGGGSFSEVNLHDLGGARRHWFRDSEIESPARDLTDPAVSRNRAWVATIRGWGSTTTVLWSKVNGSLTSGAPSLPTPWCETNEEPGLRSPAFSATSDRLAWVRPDGIWMSDGPATCAQPRLVIRGAEQPSFSLAPFSARPAR